ncbi:LysR family transcriptional regulator [Mesorhizobium sp. M1227]|uniref:LysR family transcriptional regulator n=1 Tax=Mesorhizobium sp. M1227 TaxID=2957071 RepID=UPI00333B8F89
MEIEDVRTFVEIAEGRGISPAARRLGVAKSVVSRRLARLEETLGSQLLSRTTRGAALTEAGATFRDHATRILGEFEAAQDALAPDGAVRGLLRIAAPLSGGPRLVAPVLAELARRHPLLHVHAAYSDRFVDLISEGFDAGIRAGFLPDSSLIARRIRPISGMLVASPAYIAGHGAPQTLGQLADHECLLQGTEAWRFVEGGKTIAVHPHGRFKADNGEALLSAALAGLGVAALPDFLIEPHIASGALIPLLADHTVVAAGLYVVRPPGDFPPRKVRALIDIMLEYHAG